MDKQICRINSCINPAYRGPLCTYHYRSGKIDEEVAAAKDAYELSESLAPVPDNRCTGYRCKDEAKFGELCGRHWGIAKAKAKKEIEEAPILPRPRTLCRTFECGIGCYVYEDVVTSGYDIELELCTTCAQEYRTTGAVKPKGAY